MKFQKNKYMLVKCTMLFNKKSIHNKELSILESSSDINTVIIFWDGISLKHLVL